MHVFVDQQKLYHMSQAQWIPHTRGYLVMVYTAILILPYTCAYERFTLYSTYQDNSLN